jgi:hypothetical protein
MTSSVDFRSSTMLMMYAHAAMTELPAATVLA